MSRISDEVLIKLFKEDNANAKMELIRRYTKFSKHLAIDLLRDFKLSTYAEEDELTNIGLLSFYNALDGFNSNKSRKFESYWRQIARNEMMHYIKDNSISYQTRKHMRLNKSNFQSDCFFISSPITEEYTFMRNRIDDIFEEKKNMFRRFDKEILNDILDGFNCTEIAKRRGMSFARVKRRINAIRNILSNILSNS